MPGILEVMARLIHTCPKCFNLNLLRELPAKIFREMKVTFYPKDNKYMDLISYQKVGKAENSFRKNLDRLMDGLPRAGYF